MENKDILKAIEALTNKMDEKFDEVKKEMNGKFDEAKKEMNGKFNEVKKEINEFRQEANERFESLEKLVIQNGEKLDNNREHVSRKINFIEHKSIELEQRIFELESRCTRQ